MMTTGTHHPPCHHS